MSMEICSRNVLDEESFESAHNRESETGFSSAVLVDVVKNARQYLEASEENPVNLEDVLLGMLDFNHIKPFLEVC